MDRNEALCIAISALEHVIRECENLPQDDLRDDHIAEKNEALAILIREL